MFSLAILFQDGTLETIRRSLPTDPAALFTLALSAVGIIAVLVGGRSKKGKGSGSGGAA